MQRLAIIAATAIVLSVPARSAPGGAARSWAGTWKATDAVDDYERAAVIAILRKGAGYELIDHIFRPALILRGKVDRGRLTFVWTHGGRTIRFVYTLTAAGNGLTEDRIAGKDHMDIHYVRASSPRRAGRARTR